MFYFHPSVCFIDALCVEAGGAEGNIARYPGADGIMRVSQRVKSKTQRETIKDLIVGARGGARTPRKHGVVVIMMKNILEEKWEIHIKSVIQNVIMTNGQGVAPQNAG